MMITCTKIFGKILGSIDANHPKKERKTVKNPESIQQTKTPYQIHQMQKSGFSVRDWDLD
jgi:hypothetical protein